MASELCTEGCSSPITYPPVGRLDQRRELLGWQKLLPGNASRFVGFDEIVIGIECDNRLTTSGTRHRLAGNRAGRCGLLVWRDRGSHTLSWPNSLRENMIWPAMVRPPKLSTGASGTTTGSAATGCAGSGSGSVGTAGSTGTTTGSAGELVAANANFS